MSDAAVIIEAGAPLVAAALGLIEDIVRAVTAAKEQDHDALIAQLVAARAALADARADAAAARAEGAAELAKLGDGGK